MFGKFAEAQQKAEEIKTKLDAITVEGKSEGVFVTADGNRKIRSIDIDEDLLKPENKKQLEEALISAISKAMESAENVSASEMRGLMSGMMPGLGGLFGK